MTRFPGAIAFLLIIVSSSPLCAMAANPVFLTITADSKEQLVAFQSTLTSSVQFRRAHCVDTLAAGKDPQAVKKGAVEDGPKSESAAASLEKQSATSAFEIVYQCNQTRGPVFGKLISRLLNAPMGGALSWTIAGTSSPSLAGAATKTKSGRCPPGCFPQICAGTGSAECRRPSCGLRCN
jgi:hypothetical protein